MMWLTIIAGYLLVTAVIIIAVCVLSARMSQHEDWSETPIVETRMESAKGRDYQADPATSS
ncbi:MAG: hypothetical protein HC804_01590 [Anaerolineae bacterium]|nr:hypothetical protein [Anaerolineae bacterium]